MAQILTPFDLRTRFETIIRGTHDLDDLYDMLSDARDSLEDEINLKILEKLDVSQMALPGDTYLSMKPLPADWGKTNKIVVDIIPYYPIPFNQRIGYRFSARRYYIDVLNKQFALTGMQPANKVINHFYQAREPRFVAETENQTIASLGCLLWPNNYWRLLIYEAAANYLGLIDGDDVSRSIAPGWWAQYQRLRSGFEMWDADLKLHELDGALGYADQDDRPFDVGLL